MRRRRGLLPRAWATLALLLLLPPPVFAQGDQFRTIEALQRLEAQVGQNSAPARDGQPAAPAKPGTGLIRGRVVAADTGQPIRRAQVRLNATGPGVPGQQPEYRLTTTDETGRYEFRELRGGRYILNAQRNSYVPLQWRQLRFGEPGKPIELADGQLLEKVDFALARGAAITGRIVDEFGEPAADVQVSAVRRQNSGGTPQAIQRVSVQGTAPFSSGGQLRPDGSFAINGLAPGDYIVGAQQMQAGAPGAPPDLEYAQAEITVNGNDVTGLRLTTTKASTLGGRIVRPAGDAGTLRPTAWRVAAVPYSTGNMVIAPGPVPQPATVSDDWTFQGKAKPGLTRLIVQGLQPPWIVREIRHRGVDISDSGFEVRLGDDISDIEIELTNRITELTGTVTNSRGEPIADYMLIVFPRDREKRRPPSRYIRVARPPQDGRFKGSGLPPGDYLALAVESVDPGDATDPEFLEKLETKAVSFSLREGETKTLDLKLTSLP